MSARLSGVDIPNLGIDKSCDGSYSDVLTIKRIEDKLKRFNDNSTCSSNEQNAIDDATR